MTKRWESGTTVLLQEVWHGRVWSARPMTVVSDDGGSAVLWLPRGTRWQAPAAAPTRPHPETRSERIMSTLEHEDWTFVESEWEVSSLWFVEPRVQHAVWCSWLESGEHSGWYVNLQEPFERTNRGFRWMDLMLDVVVGPDLSWQWKDQDEFDALLQRGLIGHDKAAAIRADALEVIRRVEAKQKPFSEAWPEWRPDPSWAIPQLPTDWDRL